MGYPGSQAYAKQAWTTANTKLVTAVQLVRGLADAQLAYHLVRFCLDGCKVNHLLRASDCYDGVDAEVRLSESTVLEGFQTFWAVPCSPTTWYRQDCPCQWEVVACAVPPS